jgi:hypothetical protein
MPLYIDIHTLHNGTTVEQLTARPSHTRELKSRLLDLTTGPSRHGGAHSI